jgi:hypothetical protein
MRFCEILASSGNDFIKGPESTTSKFAFIVKKNMENCDFHYIARFLQMLEYP